MGSLVVFKEKRCLRVALLHNVIRYLHYNRRVNCNVFYVHTVSFRGNVGIGVREYITDTLGIKAKSLKDAKWEDLLPYCVAGKTGRYSTWAVLNALPKWYDAISAKERLAAAKEKLAEKKADKAA